MTLQKLSGFIVQVRHSATQKIECKNYRFCAWIQCKNYVSLPGFRSPPLRFALCLWFARSACRDKAVRHWLGHVQTEQARGQVQINQLRRCLPAQPQWISMSSFLIQGFFILWERKRGKEIHIYHITFVKTCIAYTSTGLVMIGSTCIYDTRLAMQLDSGPVRRRSTHGIRSLVPCRHWALSKFVTSLREEWLQNEAWELQTMICSDWEYILS